MKFLIALLCVTMLLSCDDTANTGPAAAGDDATTQNAPAPKGTLYIENSIVGGLQISWLWLGDDGTFVRNPANGANPINYALEKTNNAAQTGHYTKDGNTLHATYETGKTEDWAMEYDGNRLNTIDGLFVGQADEMPADYRLNGSYAARTFFRNVGNISTFNFKPDGTFTLDAEGYVTTEDAAANAKKASGGTYNITGNTLHLNYDNGESTVSVIGVYKAGNSNFLVINNNYFSQP